MSKLKKLELKTKEVYESNAAAFDEQRSKILFEKKWLDKFLGHLNEGEEVLDVGCGSGDPIAKYLIEKKMKVTGVDFSSEMIDMATKRFSQNEWHVQDMRKLNLNRKFKAIIAWNSYFHLTQSDQRSVFSLFDKHLQKGGILMITVGPEKGEVEGLVNNQKVYHSSLSPDEYKELMDEHQFKLLEFAPNDPECNGHTILLACSTS
ncbi:MAG: class I SAM-dependent methyltransferase [Bacteriovoracaceae bacterium]|nr:class I SAM-dependent methyltransferase [Bacteriovoracaceae bacterium]